MKGERDEVKGGSYGRKGGREVGRKGRREEGGSEGRKG